MQDVRRMQIGQVVDFCIEYNKRHAEEVAEEKPKSKAGRRKATQAEIDAFLG